MKRIFAFIVGALLSGIFASASADTIEFDGSWDPGHQYG